MENYAWQNWEGKSLAITEREVLGDLRQRSIVSYAQDSSWHTDEAEARLGVTVDKFAMETQLKKENKLVSKNNYNCLD